MMNVPAEKVKRAYENIILFVLFEYSRIHQMLTSIESVAEISLTIP
jgi:hypothetical protein